MYSDINMYVKCMGPLTIESSNYLALVLALEY